MEDRKAKNTIDSKLKTTFAVFVIFVLMVAVTIVFLGIEMPSQESTQKKQPQVSNIESSIPKPVELTEELESQGSSFLEKIKMTITNESQREQSESQSNYFSELNCDELSDIASLFEDGWGNALAKFSARCEGSNDDEAIEQQVISLVK